MERYSYPAKAGQITLAVGDERQPSEIDVEPEWSDLRAARIAEMSWQGTEADTRLLDSYVGWYQLLRTACSPSHAMAIGWLSRRPDGLNSWSRPVCRCLFQQP